MINENFNEYFENSIKLNWNVKALSDYEGATITYHDVASQVLYLHSFFENSKIKPGDKIALIGRNSVNWAIVYLATATYGAVVVPLLADFKPKDVHNLVNHSEAKLLFTSDSIFSDLDTKEMPALQGIVSLTKYALHFDPQDLLNKAFTKIEKIQDKKKTLKAETFKLPKIPNSQLLGILYTSGTSGFSKGVMLTHNNLAANIRYAQANMPLKSGEPVLSFLPLAHAYGCAFEFLFPLTLGCHVTFLGKLPTPQIILKAFRDVKPALILAVPLIIEKIYRKQLKPVVDKPAFKVMTKIPIVRDKIYKKINDKLTQAFGGCFKELVIGGAALNPEVENFLKKIKFRFSIGYGMTECAPLISYANWDKAKVGFAGKAVDSLEVKINTPDRDTKIGEIIIRGENVMLGYYKNDAATREALDGDGWLHTGDLGVIDKDGFIGIRGRSKSMILGPSGQNIYPEEIEGVINNLPLVSESLIVERDGKLIALIYPEVDLVKEKNMTREDLKHFMEHNIKAANKELPNYMNIGGFEILDEEFDKTPKKSIKRFKYTLPNYEIHKIS